MLDKCFGPNTFHCEKCGFCIEGPPEIYHHCDICSKYYSNFLEIYLVKCVYDNTYHCEKCNMCLEGSQDTLRHCDICSNI